MVVWEKTDKRDTASAFVSIDLRAPGDYEPSMQTPVCHVCLGSGVARGYDSAGLVEAPCPICRSTQAGGPDDG